MNDSTVVNAPVGSGIVVTGGDTVKVVQTLKQLREMLIHRMKAPDIAPVVFNTCREHIVKIDEQLNKHDVPELRQAPPVRTWTREQRRKHQRAAGNTFSQRINGKVGNVIGR